MDVYEYIICEERLITVKSRQTYLNKAGASGWELVDIESGSNNGMFGSRVFTFKRKSVPPPSKKTQPEERTLSGQEWPKTL